MESARLFHPAILFPSESFSLTLIDIPRFPQIFLFVPDVPLFSLIFPLPRYSSFSLCFSLLFGKTAAYQDVLRRGGRNV